MNQSIKISKGIAPALTLLVLAPMLAEVLPGATRFSSIFVFPIEICVWGGGALLIRYAARKLQLGWMNILFMALALSVAEECIIQQTSLAPMVIQIKGVVYARFLGINFIYFLWALVYESIFVVFLPVYLVELIFPSRREDLWINKTGLIVVPVFFLLGSFLAWFSWTRIARPKVFHVPAYSPSLLAISIASAVILLLILAAVGPYRKKLNFQYKEMQIPSGLIICLISGLWAILWYGLVVLAFGIAPGFPPMIAFIIGLILIIPLISLLPRWMNNPQLKNRHVYAIISGVIVGSMIAGFIGFIGATRADLNFKIITNILALVCLLILGSKIRKRES